MINCFTKAKRKLQGPKHKCCGGSPNCIVWVFLHFSSAFEPVCAWFSLSPVMAAGPARLSELGAQAGAPSDAHSLLICVDQGLWSKTATCSSAGAGGLTPSAVQLIPLIPAGMAAVVHNSTSERKTGLISTPSQSRSVLNPAG